MVPRLVRRPAATPTLRPAVHPRAASDRPTIRRSTRAGRGDAGRTPVVFVTAYGDHAIEAFDTGAVDYLLKPIEPSRVGRMVERLQARVARPDLQGLLEGLSKRLRRPPPLEFIQSSIGREVRLIRVDEVIHFEADARYTRVVHAGGDALIRTPLKELLVQLDESKFWQIHRSVIVSRRSIEKAVRLDETHMEVTLRGREERLPVSRPFQGLFRGIEADSDAEEAGQRITVVQCLRRDVEHHAALLQHQAANALVNIKWKTSVNSVFVEVLKPRKSSTQAI